ncbi:MAG: hypothetical protein ACPGSC_08165 [Granulosicoccaceae bacterium]
MSSFGSDRAIIRACARLRRAAWAGVASLVFASWGVAYGASSMWVGAPGAEVLLMSVLGVAMSMPVVLDVLVRLGHCHADDTQWPQWLLNLSSAQRFRPLPEHLIDDGDKPACGEVEAWLNGLGAEHAEIKQLAETMRASSAGLSKAGAVNLWLYAKLRQRQLQAGLLRV